LIHIQRLSFWGWGSIVVGCLALGALGGKWVSTILEKKQLSIDHERRELVRKQILTEMKTIQVGDTLLDQEFVDLDGAQVRLSDFAKARHGAIIGIISPDCMVCVEEVSGLAALVPDSTLRNRIIFISAGSPEELSNLRRVAGLTNMFLCDRSNGWISQYKVYTYPFNIIVNQDLKIQRVIPAALEAPDIEEIGEERVATH
jgi:peroxiredoxin